jgi:spermidine synthase
VTATSKSQVHVSGGAATARSLRAVLILIGFTAVIAQIVLMRELMVVFYGNEMSLGLMLGSWLLWTALGCGVLGRLARRTRNPRRLMAILEALIAVAFPLTIFLVRASKGVLQAIPGEILGPGPMILTSLLLLGFFCVISGGLFAGGSRLYAEEAGTSTVAGTSNVYLL